MRNAIQCLLALLLALTLVVPALGEAAQSADGAVEAAAASEETVEAAAEETIEETAEEAEEEEAPKSWFETAFGGFRELHPVTVVLIVALLAVGIWLAATRAGRWTPASIALTAVCFGAALVLSLGSLFRSLEGGAGIVPYVVAIVALLALMLLILCTQDRKAWTSRRVAYAAMCLAMSFVLSMIKLFRMPQGGSVTPAAMLPLILFAMAFGPAQGLVVGCAYGLLQLIEDPYVIHPIQLLVDYPMAFGALALCCLARRLPGGDLPKLPVGVLLGYLGRYLMAVLSGVVFFAEYAGEQNALVYSLVYNISYLGVEAVLACLISVPLGLSEILTRMRKRSA